MEAAFFLSDTNNLDVLIGTNEWLSGVRLFADSDSTTNNMRWITDWTDQQSLTNHASMRSLVSAASHAAQPLVSFQLAQEQIADTNNLMEEPSTNKGEINDE